MSETKLCEKCGIDVKDNPILLMDIYVAYLCVPCAQGFILWALKDSTCCELKMARSNRDRCIYQGEEKEVYIAEDLLFKAHMRCVDAIMEWINVQIAS